MKNISKVHGSKNIHHQVLWTPLANHEILFQRIGPGDRFEVKNDPICTNIGFSKSGLSREDGIRRKGTTKFSCSHLEADISQYWASCCAAWACAEQPLVSMGVSVLRYRAKNTGVAWAESKNRYLDQERGPTFRVICETQKIDETQILYFAPQIRRILYRRKRRANMWPVESKFFSIFFLVQ